MQLALSTWQEVEEHLRGSHGIIVPIGSVEQHGPNGLIGTDHLDAEFVAKGVGDAIGCMVAPTLAYGMSQHHLAFSGSATLRPSTLMLVVHDVVMSLAVHGFRRFFFINGHGGNVATVTAAFDEIYAARSLGGPVDSVRCRMRFWSEGPRCKAVSGELYPGVNGSHATASEVSLSQYYHPKSISTRRCRRKWRRQVRSSSTPPIIVRAIRTGGLVRIRRNRHRNMGSGCTRRRSRI